MVFNLLAVSVFILNPKICTPTIDSIRSIKMAMVTISSTRVNARTFMALADAFCDKLFDSGFISFPRDK